VHADPVDRPQDHREHCDLHSEHEVWIPLIAGGLERPLLALPILALAALAAWRLKGKGWRPPSSPSAQRRGC
jgi:hypothetical protein